MMIQRTDPDGTLSLSCEQFAECITIPGDMVRMVKEHLNVLDAETIVRLEWRAAEHPRTGVI